MRPPAIQRALDRASATSWRGGLEVRRRHIRALETSFREDREDQEERKLSQAMRDADAKWEWADKAWDSALRGVQK